MPKRKRPEEKPEEQFKRFAEKATEAEVDTDAASRAFKRLTDHDHRQKGRSKN